MVTRRIAGLTWEVWAPCVYAWQPEPSVKLLALGPGEFCLKMPNGLMVQFDSLNDAAHWFAKELHKRMEHLGA